MFLHGYLSSSDSFAYQIHFFEKYFNVYAIDLKGFIKNPNMEYPYSLDDYVSEVVEYIKANKIEGANVIAHSFGGRIAIKLASQQSDVFNRIVLTGSAGLKPRRKLKYIIKKILFNLLKLFVKREKLKKFYSKDYNSLSPIMKESFKKIVGENLDDRLKFIKNKTLIINGLEDRETPPYMAKKIHKGIENSTLKFIKGAGHFAFIDKPFEFNREVVEFLLSN